MAPLPLTPIFLVRIVSNKLNIKPFDPIQSNKGFFFNVAKPNIVQQNAFIDRSIIDYLSKSLRFPLFLNTFPQPQRHLESDTHDLHQNEKNPSIPSFLRRK